MYQISLRHLVAKFKWRVSLTFFLVILDALINILFPLFIGLAIDDLLDDSYQGLVHLGLLGVVSMLVGSARRFYDTRIYSSIYCQIAPDLVENELHKDSPVSKVSARTGLLTELVEFLEQMMPMAVGSLVSLVGILVIIVSLNQPVFLACLGLLSIILLVYAVTGNWNFSLNKRYNDELERQVTALESRSMAKVTVHFERLMGWNIKLSDLETWNFMAIWLAAIALFIFTPLAIIDSGISQYGLVFSALIYVFEFIETSVTLPLHIQQLIRLKEISTRLSE